MAAVEKLRLGCARLVESSRIADMSRRHIEHGLPWRYRSDRVADLIRDAETEVVVAREGERVVGFAAMEFQFARNHAHLVLLAVEPAYRRCGTGMALFLWVEKIARLGGIQKIQLELRADNEAARALYERLGFRKTALHPGYYDGRQDAITMTRPMGHGVH